MLGNQLVWIFFYWNPEENSDRPIKFWMTTRRRQRIINFTNEIKNANNQPISCPCPSTVWFPIWCTPFAGCFLAYRGSCCVLFLVHYWERNAPAPVYSWWADGQGENWFTINWGQIVFFVIFLYETFQTEKNVLPNKQKMEKKLNHLWFIAKQCQAWQRTGLKQTNKMTKKSSKQICLCCNKIIEILNIITIHWFDL